MQITTTDNGNGSVTFGIYPGSYIASPPYEPDTFFKTYAKGSIKYAQSGAAGTLTITDDANVLICQGQASTFLDASQDPFTSIADYLTAYADFFFDVAQPAPVGFSYVQAWGDLVNDSSTQDSELFFNSGSALVGDATSAAAWQHSGRSVDEITGPFTIVLEGAMAQNSSFGLNTETTATYPATRYARTTYAFVTIQAAISGLIFSRVFELGVNKVSAVTWGTTTAAPLLGIADTGTEIKYGYSLDDGATWTPLYTSAATYVPGQVFKVDGVMNYGYQHMRVRKYTTALF
jgi:hypothetical protein